MLSHLLLASLAAGAAATTILRTGCGDVDPVWTPVDDKNVYTSVSYDGSTLCAIDTSANFVCTTPATTPLSWFTAYKNVQSGFVGGKLAGVVSDGKHYATYAFGPDATYAQTDLLGPAVTTWGDKAIIGSTATTDTGFDTMYDTADTNGYLDGDMAVLAVSGRTLYGIDASSVLFKGSLPVDDSMTASWVPVAGAPTLSEVSVGGGRVCGVTKTDKTVVCSTDDVNWTTLPDAKWAHVTVFGSTVFATDSSNQLSSYTFK
ncbi:hypothetical protein SPRG_16072 [Saprolegnia parasitica CBS 223.65]|uniref:Ig-like domain-containing protein n=1 Tax=Saprolegnia parasitica (strain CBS 223.65) TaxID=695850 RepID=A0A067BWE8_SAPPC|nr:hypothetical protein SPRG_16072 [Saprolegnia parasitica CBS 223.65]KDO18606.1 hypothetical protein SPRG_16072 [Saprolegnia parasitica CBS 223.65]|eukprot:XP_012210687.1 hypothetical protein SPRG_16072 [Saprolegnia parasitica CBS 223.65]